jgi:serine/threonine protein kinase/HEAT repeat protein
MLVRTDETRCPRDGAATQQVESLKRGIRLGAYRIERLLGEGGMSLVYEATHEVLNRRTAIKLLRPELTTNEQAVTRFLNEARAVNLIDHPNIVSVYDFGDAPGCVYFVMEFLEGQTLDDVMRKRRPMSVPLLLHLFAQVARALAAAHARQIVHRDLKPANVYVIARGDNPYFVKLLDFGIAQVRTPGGVAALTVPGQLMGTPQYMSPEQVTGAAVDRRSDVWALGVMLYRAATGEAPFRGEAFAELAEQILHETPRPAQEIAPVSDGLARLIERCLERRLDQRLASVEEVIAELDRVKLEHGLDDRAIQIAVTEDAETLGDAVPARRDPTRKSIAGSVPRYQGVADRAPQSPPPRPRPASRRWPLAAAGMIAVVAGAGYAAVRVRSHVAEHAAGTRTAAALPTEALPPDVAGARASAAVRLRQAVTGGTLQQQGFAVDAIRLARVKQGAPLLYEALRGSPEVLDKAARALGELALPESAAKLRAALAEAGEPLKIQLSAQLYRMGDRDARSILFGALRDPTERLTAAAALAEAGDSAARAPLADVLASVPAGRESWRRAAVGLMKLGDARARALLEGELVQQDATRVVAAAEVLARGGDDRARALLVRVVADPTFPRRGEAAMALARLGDRSALRWVPDGLGSTDVGDRTLAVAICGVLSPEASAHTAAIAVLARTDPDPRVRMTADAVLLSQ